MKRENFTEWDKIFANHLFDKEIISKIYKEFIQFKNKTKQKNLQIIQLENR